MLRSVLPYQSGYVKCDLVSRNMVDFGLPMSSQVFFKNLVKFGKYFLSCKRSRIRMNNATKPDKKSNDRKFYA